MVSCTARVDLPAGEDPGMNEWSLGVVVVVVVLVVAVAVRLPWRRARSLRVESRIGTAAVEFAPPSRLKTKGQAPRLKTNRTTGATPRRDGPKPDPARTAATRARRAAPRRKPKRRTR